MNLYRKRLFWRLFIFILCVSLTSFICNYLFIDYFIADEAIENIVCRVPSDLRLEINDLNKIKASFNKELIQLETKRNKLLRKIRILNEKHNSIELSAKEAQARLDQLHKKLFAGTLFGFQKKNRLIDDIEVTKNINFSKIQVNYGQNELPSLENSFNYMHCSSNNRLRISFYNKQEINFNIDIEDVDIVQENSCITIVFLSENFDMEMLNDYIINNKVFNLLFIDFKGDFFKEIENSDNILIRSGLYASFKRPIFSKRNENLNYHFSLYKFNDITSQTFSFVNKRKYIMTYHEPSLNNSILENLLQFGKIDGYLIDINCEKDSKNPYLCFNETKRSLILKESTFTFIYLAATSIRRLLEALKSGTIPIVINMDLKFPLDDFIDWNQVIIKVPLTKINKLSTIISSITDQEILARRIRSIKLFQAYFSRPKTQFRTLIAAIKERLSISDYNFEDTQVEEFKYTENSNINRKRLSKALNSSDEYLGPNEYPRISSIKYASNFTYNRYLAWNKLYYPFRKFSSIPFDQLIPTEYQYQFKKVVNSDRTCLLGGSDAGECFSHSLSGNYPYEQFTIVILTYKRDKILSIALDKYLNLPYLNRIIVVWNSLDSEPLNELVEKFNWALRQGLLKIIKMRLNSLNNRFLPFDIIETDAILSLDDDSLLRNDEIIFAFRVWRESRDRIVGFPARFHTYNLTSQSYEYQSRHTCEYSMILTGASFYHRFYHYYYTYVMNPKIKEIIDDYMNCEDLAFNYMVADLTRKPPLKVTSKWGFYCKECAGYNLTEAFSFNPIHYQKRTNCLNKFNQIYGYNPLLYSQYRADSVLFKTKLLLNKQKCFKFV